MTNSTGLELILASTLLVALAVSVYGKLYDFERVSVLDVTIWMTILFFGFGPWMAFSYGGWSISYERTGVLLGAYGGVWLFVTGLYMVRMLTSHRRDAGGGLVRVAGSSMGLVYESLLQANPLIVGACYVPVIIVRLVLALNYGMLFSGTATGERVIAVPYLLSSTGMGLHLVAMACLIWATCVIWRKKVASILLYRYLPITIIGIESLYAFLRGRRWMLQVAFLFFLGAAIMSKQVRLRLAVGGAVAALLLAMWAFPSFISVRTRYHQAPTGDAVTDLRKAIESPVPADFNRTYRANMAQRPLIVRLNCEILQAQRWHDLMWGKGFLCGIISMVPRPIYPQKLDRLQPKLFVRRHYGLPVHDTPMNWPAMGAADFGVAGGLIAGLFLGGILVAVERAAARMRNRRPFVSACAIGAMLDVAIMVDVGPTLAFAHVRNLLVILTIAFVLSPSLHLAGQRGHSAAEREGRLWPSANPR